MRRLVIRIDLDSIERCAFLCRRLLWSGLKQAAKISRFMLILAVVTGWIFSGWPKFGGNPFFPKVHNASASTAIAYRTGTVAFNPRVMDGGATDAFDPSGSYDNVFSSEITLPFTFNFYGVDYNSVWASSNGFVSFTGDDPGTVEAAQILPNPSAPNALIALVWADLYASLSNGSHISYETFGSTPNRVFVVNYLDLAQCCEDGIPRVTTQLQLYETTNVIEIHTTDITLTQPSASYTQGIENADGTAAATTKNGTDNFSVVNDGVRFLPTTASEETFATGSVVLTASTTWTAPAGVTAVNVEAWGGGGGGGGNNDATNDSGGGGGGGAYAKKSNISVTPGNGYTVVVGTGGTAVASSAGGTGNDSYFIDSSTVMAKGGGGGGANTGSAGSGTGGTAGTGGAAGSSVGDTKFSGGNGGAGKNSTTGIGGGGGGGAGTASNGNNGTASTVTGATAVIGGGPGGYGFTVAGDGLTPDIGPGGGGGGSGEGATAKGGNGHDGRVRITYIYTWTAPANVTSVDVQVWGGGGGGGGQQRIAQDGGGGGGGGAYSRKISVAVTPGNGYTVVAGGGGLGGTCLAGLAGGDSYFSDTSTVLAKGGSPGANASTGTPPAGGAGGVAGSGVGDTGYLFSGGAGGKGRDNTGTGLGGPGGSSAGSSAVGSSGATTWVDIIAPRPPNGGGIGASGGNAVGVDGSSPALSSYGNGGGGGGAAQSPSTTTCSIGGAGADGKVILTYTANTGATVDTYTTSSVVYTASTTWTAPAGVTAVNVEVWGGGGAGGGNNDSANDAGGGGGGGAYAKKSNISVTPGNGYTVVVGTGGTGVASSTGGTGNDSYFIDNSTVMAKGGGGGGANTGSAGSGTGGVAGTGGAAGSSVGDTKFSGGNGEEGTNSATGRGGGGGGSGGTAANGTVGTNNSNVGAAAVIGGGPGGYGVTTSGTTDGLPPDIGPGGGGGGAAEGATVKGGDGYAGRVRITYIYTWTAPAGVTSVDAEVWGGGGGGGGQQRVSTDGGGGGGGGAYSRETSIAVTPGNTYTVVSGAGGLGGTCLAGLAGEDSYFVNTSTVLAKGGSPGANSTGTPPAGGAGGAAASGVSEALYAVSGGTGGTGRDNSTGLGAPGGSSAGLGVDGTSGASTWTTEIAGVAAAGGGIGGNGAGTIGSNGSASVSGSGGGGGGGAESSSATTCSIGGAGTDGKVKLTYTPSSNSAPTISVAQPDGTSDTVIAGTSYNITYDLADSDDTVTAAFYYDSNNSGLDGTAISGACAAAAEGTGATCAWDTTGVTPGTYYVYGIANDGTNSAVSAYSSGQITISAAVISVSVGDGSIAYGPLTVSASRSTSTGMWDTQTATNTGNLAEDFQIQGTNSANWTLGASPGSEQYEHAFCTASCTSAPTNYTALTTSNSTLVSNVGVGSTQTFDLNLSTPTATSHYTQQSVNVTVTAIQH